MDTTSAFDFHLDLHEPNARRELMHARFLWAGLLFLGISTLPIAAQEPGPGETDHSAGELVTLEGTCTSMPCRPSQDPTACIAIYVPGLLTTDGHWYKLEGSFYCAEKMEMST